MKKLLLLAFTMGQCLYAQNTGTCSNTYYLCNGFGQPFTNVIDGPFTDNMAQPYSCLLNVPNPTFFSLPIVENGTLSVTIEQITNDNVPIVLNYIAWGPFDTPNVCGPNFLNAGTQVGCGNGLNTTEQLTIPNAQAGTYYVIVTTNFSNLAGTITFNAAGTTNTNALDCELAAVRQNIMNDLTVFPNPATNVVNISAATGTTIASLKISDFTGKTIYSTKANAASLAIDSSAFASGNYFVEVVSTANAKTVKKLLID